MVFFLAGMFGLWFGTVRHDYNYF